MEEQPPKRRKSDVNNVLCIICQEETSSKTVVKEPKADSKKKLVSCVKERAGYGEEKMNWCSQRLDLLTMAEKQFKYHKECYKEITNKTKIKRVKQRYETLSSQSNSTVTDEQCQERQDEQQQHEERDTETKTLRSQGAIFKKDRCIICQQEDGVIHKVAYMATGSKMLAVAKKMQDKSLFIRLNEIPNAEDAVANDVQYHRVCCVLAQRKAKIEVTSPQELENISQIVADIEIINKVESFLNESADTVMDMKSLNAAYNSLLETTDLNYKRYLK